MNKKNYAIAKNYEYIYVWSAAFRLESYFQFDIKDYHRFKTAEMETRINKLRSNVDSWKGNRIWFKEMDIINDCWKKMNM